jgi:hypothetical protein
MLLNPKGSVLSIQCVYPLSGQYDHLARWLFYAALVVAILFRHRTVIASAALASVITYSTVSAIHLFVLLGQYRFKMSGNGYDIDGMHVPGWDETCARRGGDVDFFGIMPMVTTTSIMLTPILTWSTTFKSDKAKALIVWWAIFIFRQRIALLLAHTSVQHIKVGR